MTNIKSLNQIKFLELFKTDALFTSQDIIIKLQLKGNSLGGFLSSLERSGYIMPLYKNNGNVHWKRVK